MKIAEVRRQIGPLYTRLREAGGIEVIQRNQERDVVMANAAEYRQLLEHQAPFHMEVRFAEGNVAMWIKGLPVHAEGDTLEAALGELAVALVDYASTWDRHLRHAPNHRDNLGYVRRVQLAGSVEAVREMLQEDARREAEEYASDGVPTPVPA